MTMTEDQAIDLADGVYEADVADGYGMISQPAGALVAAAFPVKPPGGWFTDPGFTRLEPLSVTADGHVGGHIASWSESHIGMAGRVKAPHSKSGYAFFATGALETAEGNMVNVGQITLTGGHAPLEASVAEAVAHYDSTESAWCDVAVGEDRYGIWVNGAVRPTVDESQFRAIRASSVSGDWRPINGSLEMVAVCAVNVPGFPIPRARVAGGQPVALVAAGTGDLVDLARFSDHTVADITAAAFHDRLCLIEDVVLGEVGDARDALTAAIEAARTDDPLDDGELATLALRASVYGPQSWADGQPIEMATTDCHQSVLLASLRARAHGEDTALVARATSHWDSQHREQAARKGIAQPDGSFPIADRADLGKAVRALGRAKDIPKAKRHIRRRAKALNAESSLPDSWR
jgi:hypothetical protein